MLERDANTNPASVAMILKALLLGHEIETSNGTFRYFRKGDWMSLGDDTEGEVAEEGIFKRCDVIHHHRKIKEDTREATTEHRWLLWLISISDFVRWAESISPAELAIIAANLTLNKS